MLGCRPSSCRPDDVTPSLFPTHRVTGNIDTRLKNTMYKEDITELIDLPV